MSPAALSLTFQTFTSACAPQHRLLDETSALLSSLDRRQLFPPAIPMSHPQLRIIPLSSCNSVLASRTNHTYLFVRQSQYLPGQDSQMRLGSGSQRNLTTQATGPLSSLTGQTCSESRENSLYKDNSFHSSAQFSQELIFFPSLSFPSKKLFGKYIFLFKRRLMTLLLTTDIIFNMVSFPVYSPLPSCNKM